MKNPFKKKKKYSAVDLDTGEELEVEEDRSGLYFDYFIHLREIINTPYKQTPQEDGNTGLQKD